MGWGCWYRDCDVWRSYKVELMTWMIGKWLEVTRMEMGGGDLGSYRDLGQWMLFL